VIGVRRRIQPDEFADSVVALDQVQALLGSCDVVVLCCGLNPQTQGLADARFFAAMKPGSVLVNVGRGGLVDESALLASLAHHRPERAILDVFATEPLPPDSPFWHHPQIRVSAHSSAHGSGLEARGDELFLDNLGRHARGEPLRNLVDAGDLMPMPERG
jgi:phosphoglycerate dehydrogenase-like enzyme